MALREQPVQEVEMVRFRLDQKTEGMWVFTPQDVSGWMALDGKFVPIHDVRPDSVSPWWTLFVKFDYYC
jgi:hypothetical protein